jgi:hypothetical protein
MVNERVDLLFGFTGSAARGGRDSKGQFAINWPDVSNLNRQMAQRVRASVLRAFDKSLSSRPQRSTQYLRKALEADEAIPYNLEGFAFLPEGYLDSGPAVGYWRNLESGTTKFKGRVLRGYFVTGGSFSALSKDRYGRDERFAGPEGSAKGGKGPIVTHAIEAHNYIAKGVKDWEGESGITPLVDALKDISISPL